MEAKMNAIIEKINAALADAERRLTAAATPAIFWTEK